MGINLTVVGYNNSPLSLTVSNFFGTIITSPSFNNKSDFEPGELTIDIKSILFGIPDRFIEHSSREEMLESAGLSVTKILDRLKPLLGK